MVDSQELKGKKIYGFKFDVFFLGYNQDMDKHIGKIGVITEVSSRDVCVNFGIGEYWYYPKEGIEKYLVNPETDKVSRSIIEKESLENSYYEIY